MICFEVQTEKAGPIPARSWHFIQKPIMQVKDKVPFGVERANALFATPKHQDLIYDVGMHKGEDTEFYLRKGFRVVSFEADPELAAGCRERLKSFIDDGRLIIVEGAIVAPDPAKKTVQFYRNSSLSVWGTACSHLADRDGTSSIVIEVNAVNFTNALRQHGIPYYMKIDIEGCDRLCLEALNAFQERPTYVSIESSYEIDELTALGYTFFQAIEQSEISSQVSPYPAKEGHYVEHRFEKGCSGLFGSEIPGKWKTKGAILRQYRWIHLGYFLLGHDGIVSKRLRYCVVGDDGIITKWRFRGAGRLQWLVARILRLLTGAAVPGWYDTHARHSGAFVSNVMLSRLRCRPAEHALLIQNPPLKGAAARSASR